MSNLGNFLQAHLDQLHIPGYELAARMGIGPTHLSRFISGSSRGCNPETLAKMVAGISDDRTVQAGLLEAYFRDQALPEMREWVRVTPPGRVREDAGNGGTRDDVDRLCSLLRQLALPTDVVRALHAVASAMPDHTALQELVMDLAEFTKDALTPRLDSRTIQPVTEPAPRRQS